MGCDLDTIHRKESGAPAVLKQPGKTSLDFILNHPVVQRPIARGDAAAKPRLARSNPAANLPAERPAQAWGGPAAKVPAVSDDSEVEHSSGLNQSHRAALKSIWDKWLKRPDQIREYSDRQLLNLVHNDMIKQHPELGESDPSLTIRWIVDALELREFLDL